MIRIKDLNDPGARADFAAGRAVAYLATERDLEANRALRPELEKGGHTPLELPALVVSESYYRAFESRLEAWSSRPGTERPQPEVSTAHPTMRLTMMSRTVDEVMNGGPLRALFAAGEVARVELVVGSICTSTCPACAAAARETEESVDQISGFGSLGNNDLELAELRAKVDVIGDIIDAAGLHNPRSRG